MSTRLFSSTSTRGSRHCASARTHARAQEIVQYGIGFKSLSDVDIIEMDEIGCVVPG
jgi:hypothetical protein